MNSLNILSALGATPPPSPSQSRSASSGNIASLSGDSRIPSREAALASDPAATAAEPGSAEDDEDEPVTNKADGVANEKTPLLGGISWFKGFSEQQEAAKPWHLPKRVSDAIVNSLKVVLTAITAPGRYIIACFYDERGTFSALLPIRRLNQLLQRKNRSKPKAVALRAPQEAKAQVEKPRSRSIGDSSDDMQRQGSQERAPSTDSSTTLAPSDSEAEKIEDSPARNTRSKTAPASKPADEIAPARKSIRIRLQSDESVKRRRQQRAQQQGKTDPRASGDQVANVAASLKSPSSPLSSSKVTRYPRTPAPPRPLVPRRQPSYSLTFGPDTPKKTLVIDLDETLIHSMAKGGRMSTGYMVEVKLGAPVGGAGIVLGPQVPILYYVHERPFCHEFLRKVCKWYNLIVFTASVQEYADPVIDWLERERKYFSGRYYRQHCTLRNGAYIKDLSQVEPDLSKVMILDNSPMSYIFHEDNAIPIEGWISDPTDNDLLHLVPFLEGLQYVTDVRALLALRLGETERI
ncbi:Nuclear envelope morphology protein 1 [Elasticomyces elasticus]|nr:Nuclear envelope morphology protein 1 [Elasticomyces elasticus]